MAAERTCELHKAKAVSMCLYHFEPMCDECKYHERHKDCPKDHVDVCAEISEPERKKLLNEIQDIYATALAIRNKDVSRDDQWSRDLKSHFRGLYKELETKLKEVENCFDETNSRCTKQSVDVRNGCKRILKDLVPLLKELINNEENLSEISQRSNKYKKIVKERKQKHFNSDLKSCLFQELASLLNQEDIVVLPKAMLSREIIDCLYSPISNPKLELLKILDIGPNCPSENTPLITGCTILMNGSIALVDNANWSVKLYGDTNTEIKFESPPYDIVDRNGAICVSNPKCRRIFMIENPFDTKKAIIDTKSKCYGVEYGGGKLVVATIDWHWSRSWIFRVYGHKNDLLRVIEKDRLGNPFYLNNDGYFDFCPFSDQILFLTNKGGVERFTLTGPSRLESLRELDSRNGEALTAIRSVGNMKITCYTKMISCFPFCCRSENRNRLQLHTPGFSVPGCKASLGKTLAGPMFLDIRSRKLLVCDKSRNNSYFLYKI